MPFLLTPHFPTVPDVTALEINMQTLLKVWKPWEHTPAKTLTPVPRTSPKQYIKLRGRTVCNSVAHIWVGYLLLTAQWTCGVRILRSNCREEEPDKLCGPECPWSGQTALLHKPSQNQQHGKHKASLSEPSIQWCRTAEIYPPVNNSHTAHTGRSKTLASLLRNTFPVSPAGYSATGNFVFSRF